MTLAYVVALHAMLMAAIGVQHALAASSSTDPAVICFGMAGAPPADDGSAPSRLHAVDCALCAVAASGPPPSTETVVAPAPMASAPVVYRWWTVPAAVPPLKTPRLSQGPPHNA